MNYKDLEEVDLKLHLLSGSDISVGNIVIKPFKLHEIRDYGYSNYDKNIQWISLSIDDFINSVEDKDKKEILLEQRDNIKNFDFFVKLGGKEVFSQFLSSLQMILRTDDIKILDDNVLAVDFVNMGILTEEDGRYNVNQEVLDSIDEEDIKIIHRDNFDEIVEVVKLQSYTMKTEEKENVANPANDEVRALMEHMQKMREKVEAKKSAQKRQDGNGNIDISDIVSAVSSKSNSINKINIWELTLYQLYDEYSRLELIDNYDFSLKAIMAGAQKIDLKHWSSKI